MKDDDIKLLRGFDNRQTDGQTFVNVESLSRLKMDEVALSFIKKNSFQYYCNCKDILIETAIFV